MIVVEHHPGTLLVGPEEGQRTGAWVVRRTRRCAGNLAGAGSDRIPARVEPHYQARRQTLTPLLVTIWICLSRRVGPLVGCTVADPGTCVRHEDG